MSIKKLRGDQNASTLELNIGDSAEAQLSERNASVTEIFDLATPGPAPMNFNPMTKLSINLYNLTKMHSIDDELYQRPSKIINKDMLYEDKVTDGQKGFKVSALRQLFSLSFPLFVCLKICTVNDYNFENRLKKTSKTSTTLSK